MGRIYMLFIAMFFLVFALFLIVRGLNRYQAIWLGLILFTFGCSIVGLVGLVPRFGNYNLDGLLNLPLDQPGWAWQLLEHLSLYDFMRFRLWSAFGFIVAVLGFAFSYTIERWRVKDIILTLSFTVFTFLGIWNYDPNQLFKLYGKGAALFNLPSARAAWEQSLYLMDNLMFWLIGMTLSYAFLSIFRIFWRGTIMQKRIQALFVGIGATVLGIFFIILFCQGRGSILNAHTMATTLLPVGKDYPFFDTTFLHAVPFAALVVIITVTLSILRYGFLGSWRIGARDLELQINIANQAVRLALHSFKNRFLGVQMAMEMATSCLENVAGEETQRARTQIKWAREICAEALARLDVLHNQAQRLGVNPRLLHLPDLWKEASECCAGRLEGVTLTYKLSMDCVCVWGDREHLVAVLDNILQNALEAMAEKKEPGYTPVITVEIGREYEWSYIRITDNGPGIAGENLHRVFRPFFTTKPAKSNWGLGLTYCHRVIKAHRGFINLKSRPGAGTTFEVVLRRRENLHIIPKI